MKIKTFTVSLFSIFMVLAAVSCSKKNIKSPGDKVDMTTSFPANPVLEIQESTDTVTTEGDIRGEEFISQDTIRTVYFDFDMYSFSEQTRKIMQQNADVLKVHKDWAVLVEGHCDSRGTVEYNLALGQKRAREVRDYYIRLGVPESSIGTISYGKEKPACEEETEDCWAKNRKAETKVKLR